MWTLVELTDHVRFALEVVGLSQQNGQITDIPNARTIRYYTTIGLLDRPGADGRTATYGPRHLAQLVAIKRLQAEGLPLTKVQERLLGLGQDELDRLAALPALPLQQEPHGPKAPAPTRRADAFWGAPPAPAEIAPAPETFAVLAGVTLPEGVSVTFTSRKALSNDDLDALRAALRPVVDTLRARGLLEENLQTTEGDEP